MESIFSVLKLMITYLSSSLSILILSRESLILVSCGSISPEREHGCGDSKILYILEFR